MTHRLHLAPFALVLLAACPQAQPPAPTPTVDGAHPAPDDPRVVAVTGDLYAAQAAPTALEQPEADPAPKSPGTGRPDETNGVCRLYAPELPNPECCEHTLGFDSKVAAATCGLQVYLGESFHNSCGFYFVPEPNSLAQWFRIAFIMGDTPLQAAEDNLKVMRHTDPTVTVEPVPDVPGAYWTRQNEYRWAFLPGWKSVRMFAWKTSSCSDDKVGGLLRHIIAAPEDIAGTRRDGLVPVAAPPVAVAPAK
ncbi:hypothetical protein [Nannocystis pusilla]|uniref:Lipoprotein n=1 Tax=Nannocystis pusilla TaxID=889268 RepID=A0ABS7TYR3_9BACT|nr:hypothetical protein [Nannocystis pusilla]MBZ5713260.1 hypothetical protein [Nannocystis pusilla]